MFANQKGELSGSNDHAMEYIDSHRCDNLYTHTCHANCKSKGKFVRHLWQRIYIQFIYDKWFFIIKGRTILLLVTMSPGRALLYYFNNQGGEVLQLNEFYIAITCVVHNYIIHYIVKNNDVEGKYNM